MSQRPKHIRLLGVSIPLIVSNCKSEDLEDDDEVFGMWDGNEMVILLNSECGEIQERTTLLHELLHAIDDFLYLQLKHREIYSLSQTLYQVLADNPQLVSYLLAGFSKERNGDSDSASSYKTNKSYRCYKDN